MPQNETTDPRDKRMDELAMEIHRLRNFLRLVATAPDAMVCRLTRDAARQILDGVDADAR